MVFPCYVFIKLNRAIEVAKHVTVASGGRKNEKLLFVGDLQVLKMLTDHLVEICCKVQGLHLDLSESFV